MEFKEAIERFKQWRGFKVKPKTVRGYDLVLRQFCLFVRNCEIEQVRIEDVTHWFALMQQLDWDYNSFLPKAMALRKFFEFYHRQNYDVIDPWLIPIPQKQYKIPRVAGELEYQKLLRIIPVKTNDPRHIRNRAIVMMLWDTGARNGEIVALDIEDVDTEAMRATIQTEKAKWRRPIREIFWTKPTNEAVKRWIEKREHLRQKMVFREPEALFISICGAGGQKESKSGYRFTIKGVGEMLRRYSDKAGIPPLNAHSFRHHMGHDIVKKGGSASDIANILGHSSIQSSMIYTMMRDKELEERYRKFKGR